MKKRKSKLDEAAEKISIAACESIGKDINLGDVLSKAVISLKGTSTFKMAAYLKYNFGPTCSGMDEEAWLYDAENLLKITKGLKL